MTFSAFWFEEITPKQWWATSDDLDKLIESRFGALHCAAGYCELYSWRELAKGRLAEIIILDQFSPNIYRNHPKAFTYDSLALALWRKRQLPPMPTMNWTSRNGPSCICHTCTASR
jgi:uncharacterized protein (DUF924 family)